MEELGQDVCVRSRVCRCSVFDFETFDCRDFWGAQFQFFLPGFLQVLMLLLPYCLCSWSESGSYKG